MGTTSACAENTSDGKTFPMIFWNYLRVRGEYLLIWVCLRFRQELPPRARRIRLIRLETLKIGGTTSACAENTQVLLRSLKPLRNYLRVRGEYGYITGVMTRMRELPPRARRIPPVSCPTR